MTDLTDWEGRRDHARALRHQTLQPTADHITLLTGAGWRYSDCEFGAAEIDGKRPYGNSSVERDLEELLPHLSEDERLRVHTELPAVLQWLCTPAVLAKLTTEESS